MQSFDIVITGDPHQAKAAVVAALWSRRFKVIWGDEWSGLAETGNRTGNFYAGPFSSYFKAGVRVVPETPEQTILHFEQVHIGWVGGEVEAAQLDRTMRRLKDGLVGWFQQQGTLVGVTET